MAEFLAAYGSWIVVGLVFLLMLWMHGGGHGHQHASDESPRPREGAGASAARDVASAADPAARRQSGRH